MIILGRCLCGAVHLECREEVTELLVCHCASCRKYGGASIVFYSASNPLSSGSEHVSSHHSSAWGERFFCKQCGSHLFYKNSNPDFYHVAAGLFNLEKPVSITREIFAEKKPAYLNFFSDSSKKITEQQVLEYLKR